MYLNKNEIEKIKSKINSNNEPWISAYNRLMSEADSELSKSYYSVTKNGGNSNKHSYYSEGAYYWPCDDNPCGKDCSEGNIVTCDGQYNPNADRSDYEERLE